MESNKMKEKLKKNKKKSRKSKSKTLNPMLFYPAFPHIAEKIFDHLDQNSLKKSREVTKPWQNCIDTHNILWKKLVKKENGNNAFQQALKFEYGANRQVKLLFQYSTTRWHMLMNQLILCSFQP